MFSQEYIERWKKQCRQWEDHDVYLACQMVKGIGLGEPKNIEKEQHFDGPEFSFIESAMVFWRGYSCVGGRVCLLRLDKKSFAKGREIIKLLNV